MAKINMNKTIMIAVLIMLTSVLAVVIGACSGCGTSGKCECGCDGECIDRIEELENRVEALEAIVSGSDAEDEDADETEATMSEETTTTTKKDTGKTQKPDNKPDNSKPDDSKPDVNKPTTEKPTDNDNLGEWTEGWD